MFRHTYVRRALLAVTAGAAVLTVAAGCGGKGTDGHSGMPGMGGSASASAAKGDHNSADVMFAQMMIPHHRQAVEMAALVPSRASSTKVKDLAKQIAGAQDPEIRTMSSWLKGWGEKVPAAGDGHGGMGMDDGMMSDADMAKLKTAKGTAFDTMFARMMIAHHNGAIAMARDEQRNGRNPAAVKLAKQIIRTQTAEVATLRDIAGG